MSRWMFVALLMLLAWPRAAEAAGQIEMELGTEEGFPVAENQRWLRVLTELKVANLRIRSARPQDKIEVNVSGADRSPIYRVTGRLTARGELMLPGGRFTLRDTGRLAEWLKKLSEDGPGGDAAKTPFGISAPELAKVHADLTRPVGFSTLDVQPEEAVQQLKETLELPLSWDANAAAALRSLDPIAEELQGFAAGTALAYMLRPAGLALRPVKSSAGSFAYVISEAAEGQDIWPIGLPAEDRRKELCPDLTEFFNVELEDVPLSQVLAALSQRLNTPILLDYNALAEQEIDPTQFAVSLPDKRIMYVQALRAVLTKARMKPELRMDEAEKPFIWVTSIREKR